MTTPLVLKLGGELIESRTDRLRIARLAAAMMASRQIVIVHGGGRSIDAELSRRQIVPKKIDGLRITDAETLDVVVSVLAGSANTDLVAAFVETGVKAVGLTGVDGGLGRAVRTRAHRATSGALVDLGFVGDPVDIDASLIELLIANRYVPVIASLGWESGSTHAVLNVNADVMACRLAAALKGSDLVIAGATGGVLDERGASIADLDPVAIEQLISGGTATAGMVAKLEACRTALGAGVSSIRLVDGRKMAVPSDIDTAPGTLVHA